MLSEDRWNRLLAGLCGRPAPPDQFKALVSAYAEPHRHYHNAGHVIHCLAELDTAADLAESPDEVEFALWLHDAIYLPEAADNEEKSARWAHEILREAGCNEGAAFRVRELILATRHKEAPAFGDAALMVDIDLSILGQPPTLFDRYERAIREEYSGIPDDIFASRRYRILSLFLNRSSVYYTEHFSHRYNAQAKDNLARALAALKRIAPTTTQEDRL